jgi:hypothetical protein
METAFIVLLSFIATFSVISSMMQNKPHLKRSSLLLKLGSLKAAVILMIASGIWMAAATFAESSYGTAFAKEWFYSSPVFTLMLAAVWINIACATVLRLPYSAKKFAFYLTHAGILILMVGMLITRYMAIEGMMRIVEGGKSSVVQMDENVLRIKKGKDSSQVSLASLSKETVSGLKLLEYYPDANMSVSYIKNTSSEGTALELSIGMHQQSHKMWLALEDMEQHSSKPVQTGMMDLTLNRLSSKDDVEHFLHQKSPDKQGPTLRISEDNGATFTTYDISEGSSIALSSGTTLVVKQLFSNAVVTANGDLMERNAPDMRPNPAVSLLLITKEGMISTVRFEALPFYQGKHHAEHAEPMIYLENMGSIQQANRFDIGVHQENFYYQMLLNGEITAGPLEEGQCVFFDKAFHGKVCIGQLLPYASEKRDVSAKSPEERGSFTMPVVRYSYKNKEHVALFNEEIVLENKNGVQISAVLQQRVIELPFSIELKDFRKVDYPNTRRAKAYESDIVVHTGMSQFETTVSMNNVLDYGGYRFFQSGFDQTGDGTEVTVFQVAKDPGLITIYLGSLLMLIGISLLYMFAKSNPQK